MASGEWPNSQPMPLPSASNQPRIQCRRFALMDASQAKAARPLDDVMIAMDVVDTLRHDRRILERELNDETRRAELIERLREPLQGARHRRA